MDTGIPLFFSEIEYLLLETIPLDTIIRVYLKSGGFGHTQAWDQYTLWASRYHEENQIKAERTLTNIFGVTLLSQTENQ